MANYEQDPVDQIRQARKEHQDNPETLLKSLRDQGLSQDQITKAAMEAVEREREANKNRGQE
jgi:hypothetical protein